jgi:hypothetical protein
LRAPSRSFALGACFVFRRDGMDVFAKMISGDRGRRYPRTMRSEVKHSRLTWG